MHRIALAIPIGAVVHPTIADETEGRILDCDRLANILVMQDRTAGSWAPS